MEEKKLGTTQGSSECSMEERTPAQGSPRMSNGSATKLLGVDKDELERIVAAGLGSGV